MLDLVKGAEPGLVYPVPWARDSSDTANFLLTRTETIGMMREAGFSLVRLHETAKNINKDVLEWFKEERKTIAEDREVGFEKFLPDWTLMVESQIENIEKDHIRFECLVFQKD